MVRAVHENSTSVPAPGTGEEIGRMSVAAEGKVASNGFGVDARAHHLGGGPTGRRGDGADR